VGVERGPAPQGPETIGAGLGGGRALRIHLVGIAGAGMSALATVLAEMGHRVSGSDVREHPRFDRLRLLGVTCAAPQDPAHVPGDADAVIPSSAVPDDNPELQRARELGLRVLSRAEALAGVVAMRRGIGVAGTHGKTTTSSMLTACLRAAGWRPGFVIGSELNEVGTNAAWGEGDWLVVEADESDGTFLRLPLRAGLVTNVGTDHLWSWGSAQALRDAFAEFVTGIDGPVVCCLDDPGAAALRAHRADAHTYGWDPAAEVSGRDYRPEAAGSSFELVCDGRPAGRVCLAVRGAHHAQNALGAIAAARILGVDLEIARRALAGFGGVARRFQHKGTRAGVAYVDDYALLPPEVAATIRAAREGPWRRVVAVFQPFRYARTAVMWEEFADAFCEADHVVLTDVCGFHERPIPGVTGRLILRAVLDAHPRLDVTYVPHRGDLARIVARLARPGDVVLTLGGGDITFLADEILTAEAPA
jgi:UDP-N-acetylmuramate--alanine ligase